MSRKKANAKTAAPTPQETGDAGEVQVTGGDHGEAVQEDCAGAEGGPAGAAPGQRDPDGKAARLETEPEIADHDEAREKLMGFEDPQGTLTTMPDEEPEPTPQHLVMYAAVSAASALSHMLTHPSYLKAMPADVDKLAGILDTSPDLPASAIVKALRRADRPDLPEAAAEALKACYVGMAAWVKAENERRKPKPDPMPRRGQRYEKSEREGRKAGAKNASRTEQARIRANHHQRGD